MSDTKRRQPSTRVDSDSASVEFSDLKERAESIGKAQAPKKGYGGVLVPPRPELRSSPAHELTRTDGVFQPSPGSAPMPPQKRSFSPPPGASPAEERAIEREALAEGGRVVRAPESRADRSYSPPPQSVRNDFRADRRGITVTWGTVRTVLYWATPVILTVVGAVTGYFQGLRMAGERVAAVEERARLNAEANKTMSIRLDAYDADLNRAFVVIRDHESRLPKLKTEIEEVRGAQSKIQGLAPK